MAFEPQVFGNYYLLEHIAYGGMAEIYRAKSFGASGFERELVLKRVLKKLTENPDFLTMLTNEAKLTATLQHGNIAQVFELGLLDGVYFITMEYVEGVSLKELLKALSDSGEKLSPHEAAYIAIQMCQGLDYAHRKTDPMGKPLHIVHCDISPDNAIIAYDGNVKVVDFGIARAQASFSNYKEGMVMGKFNYVAPEQAMGRPVDCRADVFSTGIVLYELLTGEHPFGRKGDVDTLIRIAKFTTGEVQPPHVHRQEVPEDLSGIVMKALANDRDGRYPSGRHFANELLTFLHPMTPAHVHQQIHERLQRLFAERIAKRREARSHDPAIIRDLQRTVAERQAQESADEAAGPVTSAGPAATGPMRFVVPAVTALVGAAAGFGLSTALAPASDSVLFVTSDPPGATVRLERAEVGKSPVAVEIEPRRPYLLEISHPGHQPFSKTFSADGARLFPVEASLEAQLAPLQVSSEPVGADVEINGEHRGVTPVQLDLPVGSEARVKVTHAGAVEERVVSVDAQGSALRFRFEPPPPQRRRR